ncbi:MAG: hypothetical protein ACE148_09630 [Vicinamibacterales bacterium]
MVHGETVNRLPDAHVIEIGQRAFKVVPGIARVLRTAGFELRNLTDWWLTVEFPKGVLTPDERLTGKVEMLEAMFPSGAIELLIRAVRWVQPRAAAHFELADGSSGVHIYSVTVHTDKGPVDAEGASPPRIIIE